MNSSTLAAVDVYHRQIRWACTLTLLGLFPAVLYEWRSTPYTMTAFLSGSPIFLFGGIFLFVRAVRGQVQARRQGLVPKQYQEGDIIFRQGDPADSIFLIAKGEVEAVYEHPQHGRIPLGRFGPESYFGEGAVFNQDVRQATARATTAVELLALNRDDFFTLYTHLPELREHLQSQLAHRRAVLAQAKEAKAPASP